MVIVGDGGGDDGVDDGEMMQCYGEHVSRVVNWCPQFLW